MKKLFKGNCLELIKKIEDNSINCLITDPPYSIGTTSTGNRGSWLDNNLIIPFFDQLFSEIKIKLKRDADLYINTDWRTYPFLYPLFIKHFSMKNCIVWDYEWIKAGSHYRFSHEFIIFGCNNEGIKRKFEPSKENRDVWRIPPVNFTVKKNHPAEKPVELIEKMILNSTKKGDFVLDTFMGSGSTGIASIKNDRNFIGFEIDENYFEVAKKRIGSLQKGLF